MVYIVLCSKVSRVAELPGIHRRKQGGLQLRAGHLDCLFDAASGFVQGFKAVRGNAL
jgi:hypothetical protein